MLPFKRLVQRGVAVAPEAAGSAAHAHREQMTERDAAHAFRYLRREELREERNERRVERGDQALPQGDADRGAGEALAERKELVPVGRRAKVAVALGHDAAVAQHDEAVRPFKRKEPVDEIGEAGRIDAFAFGGKGEGKHGGFQVSGFRSQVSGLRFQVSGFRFQVSGHRFQVTGFRSQVSGGRFQEAGGSVGKEVGHRAVFAGGLVPRA